ncbi:MAG TPA: L-threonylcarbamoyladenylate synthase [Syntrophobacter fumaroxidans]|nr:L-threonylcarbamoyladenylate synthase [Syntrophobacter fumaroxidans]
MEPLLTGAGTLIWRVGTDRSETEVVEAAISLLTRGGIVVYPTETFYGLGGNPLSPATVAGIFAIKKRERGKALPLIASGIQAVREWVEEFPALAERLAAAFWPGPLTLILRAVHRLPPQVHASTGKIAVRVSSHPVARALAASLGGLIVSTSANFTGQRACRTLAEIPIELVRQIDGVIDAGRLPGSLPSTIVDVTGGSLLLVRQGCVPFMEIERAAAL